MKKPYFLVRISDNEIVSCMWYDDPDAGPGKPVPEPMEGFILVDTESARAFTREGHSDTERAFWTNDQVTWIETATLDLLRTEKSQFILIACRNHIESGFLCSALGEPHLYPAKAQDQANLIGSVTDSLLFGDEPDWVTPFWCADPAGLWQFRMHTRLQIQQVGRTGKISILQAMGRNETIQAQIVVATAQELTNITWSVE